MKNHATSTSLRLLIAPVRWTTLLLVLPLIGCDASVSPTDGEQILGTITGVIIGEAGGPVAGVSVTTAPASTAVITDAQGRFILNIPLDRSMTLVVIV